MAKKEMVRYVCSNCGNVSLTWNGRCSACNMWGTYEKEEIDDLGQKKENSDVVAVNIIDVNPPQRLTSGITELDRVLGGGWVTGGVVLLGGQPGIGKSTLLLQVCGAMSSKGKRILYISGEESASQVALRAKRLNALRNNIDLFCDTDLDAALHHVDGHDFVVLDSVQAMKSSDEDGWPGTPSQVRAVAQRCIDSAKKTGIPFVLVGHITKEGRIAGPMLLEHMVDAVLLFSGEDVSAYRMIRGTKNRYGNTDELGIFEMTEKGLIAVDDPSGLYWNKADASVPGVAVTVITEGSVSLMAEIQALANVTTFPYPKRTSRGIDVNKVHLLSAVLEKRGKVACAMFDIYMNVTGGLVIKDPGADLAIAIALASSVRDFSLPSDCCFLGEVGLAGEIRPVGRVGARLREAGRLGFKKAVISAQQKGEFPKEVEICRVSSLHEALREVMP
ncbi:MAG: DNA repair protein RadA [Aminobacterium sp.]|jgi:DNA repair protein RadA/Sms|nr:DNA repair protein RadA [Aminobacterium sp.]MDD3426263.1 DNA repair protein RadA [Aminobacterium sp.]MDD3706989.1 DNA repair protein RadA [Aminobacterium sp.]MDD4228416.1 DNA repair protein RadA [Aminobacterium sp.]MDD4551339.1 DNA repair protein RadA [Aminobacterium sp.]